MISSTKTLLCQVTVQYPNAVASQGFNIEAPLTPFSCEKVVGTAKGLRSTLQSGRLSNSYISNSNSIKFEIAHRISTFCPFCFFLGGADVWQLMDRKDTKSPMLAALPQHLWLLCAAAEAPAPLSPSLRRPGARRSEADLPHWKGPGRGPSYAELESSQEVRINYIFIYIYIHMTSYIPKKLMFMCFYLYLFTMYIKSLSRPWPFHFMKKLLPSGKSRKPSQNRIQ